MLDFGVPNDDDDGDNDSDFEDENFIRQNNTLADEDQYWENSLVDRKIKVSVVLFIHCSLCVNNNVLISERRNCPIDEKE